MKPLFIKKNGTVSKVSGIIMNLIPSYTMAEYNALTHKPLLWVRTDEEYAQIPAEDVSYGSGSVEDALDNLMPTNLIKKRTFSGTTNSNGEIGMDVPSTAIVVETQINNGYFRLRTARSGNNLYVIVGYANGTSLANTNVSGTVYYIEP